MDRLELNTFSIVARCKKTGMLGMAVSTARPAVGSLAVFVRSGVGAIASQAAVNPYFGIDGLNYLENNMSAEDVMKRLQEEDEESEKRQLAIVDNQGRTAAYTGDDTIPWAGDYVGDEFVVVGNMLVGEEVIQAMANAYETSEIDYLPERLMAALKAGQDAGGDKRGKQSAALYVADHLEYPLVDIRADEHTDPVYELDRIYKVWKEELLPYRENLPIYENR